MHKDTRLVGEVCGSLIQVRNELPVLAKHDLVYFPDFNLIYPYVHRQTEERYRFTDALGTCLFSLNNNLTKPSNIHICISLPTTIEFLYFLQRHYDLFQHLKNDKIASYVYKCLVELEEGRMNVRDIESDRIKNFLMLGRDLTDYGERTSRFMRAMVEQKVDMLTDYYPMKEINTLFQKKEFIFDEINRTMRPARAREDRRSDLSKEIAYKVDAHNIFLPTLNELHSGRVLNFVCSGRFYNWTSNRFLRTHQRSPLFLIMLIANLRVTSDGEPLSKKIKSLDRFLDEQIKLGNHLYEYCDRNSDVSLEMDRLLGSFLYSNFHSYLNMAKDLSSDTSTVDSPKISEMPSYADYLDMIDGRKRNVQRTMKTFHSLIDDTRDDQYRDFMDVGRIRSALSALKLR
jgi:hypothetical protein